jgi:signal peptide peptidase SppA
MKYSRIVAEFYRRVWAVREETLVSMRDLINQQSAGAKWSREEIGERIEASNLASGYVEHESLEARYLSLDKQGRDLSQPMVAGNKRDRSQQGRNNAAPGSVAVIPMIGIISHRMSMMSEVSGGGGGSTQALTAQFRQAIEDTNCKAIIFDVDSPGGSIEGVVELSSEIYNARKTKPITAVCNAMACSAAYWLASAASEVVCSPSGNCGSIGVYMMLQDASEALKNEGIKITILKAGKYKAEGHPAEPLTDDARNFLQGQVDTVYSMFVKAVAQQRGVSQGSVRDGMGQGRSLLATDAVKANLADRTGTLDSVLARLLGRPGTARKSFSEDGAEVGEPGWSQSLSRRRRELVLAAAGWAPGDTSWAPRDYLDALNRRRRELDLVAGVIGPISRGSGDWRERLARRRRELELL